MADWNLRVVLHRLWGDQPLSYRSWAVQPEPKPLEREFWHRRDVDVLELPFDQYGQILELRRQPGASGERRATLRRARSKGSRPSRIRSSTAALLRSRARAPGRRREPPGLAPDRPVRGQWSGEDLAPPRRRRALPTPGSPTPLFVMFCSWGEGRRRNRSRGSRGRRRSGLAAMHVILDQFEEYFLYHEPDSVRRRARGGRASGTFVRTSCSVCARMRSRSSTRSRAGSRTSSPIISASTTSTGAARARSSARSSARRARARGGAVRAEPELVEAVLDQVAAGKVESAERAGRRRGRRGADRGAVPAARVDGSGRRAGARVSVLQLATLGSSEARSRSCEPISNVRWGRCSRRAGRGGHVRPPRHAIRAEDRPPPWRPRPVRGGSGGRAPCSPSAASGSCAPWTGRVEGSATKSSTTFSPTAFSRGAARSSRIARPRWYGDGASPIAIAAVALLALGAMTAVALFALFQREHAQDAARRANARGLAAQADALMDVDPARSVALAAQAAQLEPSLDVERQLREALIGSRVRAVFRARGGAVTDAALSPDSGRVAVASATGWIRVFDSRTLRLLDGFAIRVTSPTSRSPETEGCSCRPAATAPPASGMQRTELSFASSATPAV